MICSGGLGKDLQRFAIFFSQHFLRSTTNSDLALLNSTEVSSPNCQRSVGLMHRCMSCAISHWEETIPPRPGPVISGMEIVSSTGSIHHLLDFLPVHTRLLRTFFSKEKCPRQARGGKISGLDPAGKSRWPFSEGISFFSIMAINDAASTNSCSGVIIYFRRSREFSFVL